MSIIELSHINKIYRLYDRPTDRIREALNPRRKSYHKAFHALDDVSLTVEKGETLGIIGQNGSGKSTLLKIITEIITPTSGTAQVEGRVSALLELGAGFNQEFTGIENIYLNGTILGYTEAEMDEKMEAILAYAGIGDYVHQPVKTYSSGMFVRLAFAVAINVDPEILIVDEALAVGDLSFQLKCMDTFTQFREKGITILFVSHDLNTIRRFCTRCIWLKEGHVEMEGDTDAVAARYDGFLKSQIADGEAGIKHMGQGTNQIAHLEEVRLLDQTGAQSNNIPQYQSMGVEVDYTVLSPDAVKKPVLGVAILSADHKYVCGLNTLLDNQPIPWKKGKNTLSITYPKINLANGEYYLDVALYEQNATVPLQYLGQAKRFWVQGHYVGEGMVILEHKWETR